MDSYGIRRPRWAASAQEDWEQAGHSTGATVEKEKQERPRKRRIHTGHPVQFVQQIGGRMLFSLLSRSRRPELIEVHERGPCPP